ncbi:MAG: hypothetical protein ACI97K_002295 [Glaciecola sp.]|jgi:hypothetical protein
MTHSTAFKFVCIAAISLAMTGCFSTAKLPTPAEDTRSAAQILAQKRQNVAFGQVLYSYFQGAPDKTLLQDALTRLNELTAQTPYDIENKDRLDLMKGAVSLQLGMTQQAESIFNRLLSQSADPYIQANTWFWLAKSSFGQKRWGVSERAYNSIIENDIEDELSEEHFEELIYQVSHERMNTGGDWETLAEELRSDSIYNTYLIANKAVMAHNQQDYDTANDAFIAAKLLLNDTPVENSIQDKSDSLSWWSWFNWFGNGLSETQENQAFKERNALFDRLNYGLGVSLLEQKDYANALLALKLIGRDSLQAEQALLTYGWTLAKENRWPLAMAAWQYLRDNSQGIYALQASHGLAYGYEQQGALAEAFSSLRDSSRQLDLAMGSLSEFDVKVQQADFFDGIHGSETIKSGDSLGNARVSNWPIEHRDLQILLLSGDGEIDSAYLLSVRRQAKQLLNTLEANLSQIDGMYRLLEERELAFFRRSESLSLTDAQTILKTTELRIAQIESVLGSDATGGSKAAIAENEKSALLLLANKTQVAAIKRLEKAEQRIARVNNERERQLSKKYAQRVARLKGVLAWELSIAYPDTRWQHQKQLNRLNKAFTEANNQYTRLQKLQSDTSSIEQQRIRVDVMAASAQQDFTRTKALVDSLTLRLTDFIRENMALRMQELSDQQVATRLAIIRLQDLAQPVRGQ